MQWRLDVWQQGPYELLNLRIKDVEFKEEGNGYGYARVVVNGKTGERVVPTYRFYSLRHSMDFLIIHKEVTERLYYYLIYRQVNQSKVNAMFKGI